MRTETKDAIKRKLADLIVTAILAVAVVLTLGCVLVRAWIEQVPS